MLQNNTHSIPSVKKETRSETIDKEISNLSRAIDHLEEMILKTESDLEPEIKDKSIKNKMPIAILLDALPTALNHFSSRIDTVSEKINSLFL